MPGTVESPIARDDIQPAIAIEIAGRHARPPARVRCEAEDRRQLIKFTSFKLKDADWAPLTGQDQFRATIARDITEDGGIDEADSLKALVRGEDEFARFIAVDLRGGRFGI